MTTQYNLGRKNFLSFGIPFHRYFQLAALLPNDQINQDIVRQKLFIPAEDAQEFIDKCGRIRAHYDGLKPKPVNDYEGLSPFVAHLRNVQPKTVLNSSAIEVRDRELTNVFFMRDLGLLSTRAANALAAELKTINIVPANLDDGALRELAKVNLNAIPGMGQSNVIEACRILSAYGLEPAADSLVKIKVDFETAFKYVRQELAGTGFHPSTVNALLGHTARRAAREAAIKTLRPKLSSTVIALVL